MLTGRRGPAANCEGCIGNLWSVIYLWKELPRTSTVPERWGSPELTRALARVHLLSGDRGEKLEIVARKVGWPDTERRQAEGAQSGIEGVASVAVCF